MLMLLRNQHSLSKNEPRFTMPAHTHLGKEDLTRIQIELSAGLLRKVTKSLNIQKLKSSEVLAKLTNFGSQNRHYKLTGA